MRPRSLFAILIFVIFAAGAQAQSNAQILIPQMDGWRVHLGDDPAWASPAFDDSSWTTANLDFAVFPRELLVGRSRWFRKRITLSDQPGSLRLGITGYDGCYEVYVDGRRVSPPIQSSLLWRTDVTRIFSVRGGADPARKDVVVAIRSHLYDQPFFISVPPAFAGVGDPAGATRYKQATDGEVLGGNILALGVNSLLVLAGGILLSLYLQQGGRREYLWLGLCVLCSGLTSLLFTAAAYLPVSWNGFLGDPCEYWFYAAELEFVYAFVGRRPHRIVRLYEWLLVAAPFVFSPLAWSGAIGVTFYSWLENGLVLPGIVIPIAMLIAWAVRGNREAAVLIGPMFLANIGSILVDFELAYSYVNPSFPGLPRLHFGLVTVTIVSAAQAIFLLAVGLVIFQRFVRVSRDQVRTQSELEAARAVQQVLIPDTLPSVPGFRIDSAYHPAQQVGGDFFQIIPLAAGGVLTVIGDVSGKGMPAALTVALVVGTLRTLVETTSSPAEILAGLNRLLAGRSTGFTTCVAVRILANGAATLASAGHLNPYVSSAHAAPREVAVSAGLPLGLTAEAAYTDAPLALAQGETITFLSDGVVEARNARGELFGFERARAVSAQPAEEIARTAEMFGQEDDITVLTLTVMGAAA